MEKYVEEIYPFADSNQNSRKVIRFKCSECGSELETWDRYCWKCGRKLNRPKFYHGRLINDGVVDNG